MRMELLYLTNGMIGMLTLHSIHNLIQYIFDEITFYPHVYLIDY